MIDPGTIRSMYEMRLSTTQIAKELGISQAAVWKRLKQMGVEMRPKSFNAGPRNKREPKPKEPKKKRLPRYVKMDMQNLNQVLQYLVSYDLMGSLDECPCGSGLSPTGNFGKKYPLIMEWSCDVCDAAKESP